MAVSTAPERTDDGHVSYIRTDAGLPPVAIVDRSPITPRHKLIFGIIALAGAVAWAVIAFARGETVNAVWFVIAAVCTYVIGYRFYARLIELKIVRPRDDHATPAEIFENGTDYMPTDRRVLFGHHFAAIAGAGPLVGPVLAAQMGYLPGTIWIIIGAVLAGCVQDYLVLWISTRRRGDRWFWHWDPQFISGSASLPPIEVTEVDRLYAAVEAILRSGVPMLLVRGQLSDLVSEDRAEAFLARFPQVEFVDVRGAGHMVAGDRNDIFADAVLDFLARHADAPGPR
ncbi:Carbon starvation protein A [Mycobacterium talmoniae]|uniref:Carbon starvation protein A n=1 Tax=Mycobacterium talmoniae TaxID=1858794 RepID=A0A2S8BMJ3_9MYCO|nr:Carbon starvation protein A [Mycobacterium talmoniae]